MRKSMAIASSSVKLFFDHLLVGCSFIFVFPSYFDLKEDEHFKKHTGYPKHNAKQGAVKHFFFFMGLGQRKKTDENP